MAEHLDKLINALKNADAAAQGGNEQAADDARKLATEIKRLQSVRPEREPFTIDPLRAFRKLAENPALTADIAAPMGPAPVSGEPQSSAEFLNKAIFENNPLSAAVDLISGGQTLATKGINKVLGADIPLPGPPFLGSEFMADTGRRLGVQIPERQPETAAEKAFAGAGLAAGAVIPTGLAAKSVAAVPGAAQKPLSVLRKLGDDINNLFVRRPVVAPLIEVSAGAGGGSGGEFAAKKLGEGARPYGEIIGSLLAGLGPAGVVKGGISVVERFPVAGAVIRGINKAIFPFTKYGARIRASERLRSLSSDPDAQLAQLSDDSILSLPQQTGDERVMALEQLIMNQDAGLTEQYKQRTAEVSQLLKTELRKPAKGITATETADFLEARQEYLKLLIKTRMTQATERAEQTLAAVAPGMKESEAALIARNEMELALSDTKTQERQFWAMISPDARSRTSELKKVLATLTSQLSKAEIGELPAAEVAIIKGFKGYSTVKEVHGLSSQLRRVARKAAAEPDGANRRRIANLLADAAMDDIGVAATRPTENAKLIRQALDFTRLRVEAFNQGTVGKLLGRVRDGGVKVPGEETLKRSIGRSGVSSFVALKDIQAAVRGIKNTPRDSTAVNSAISDYIKRRFVDSSTSGGKFSSGKAIDFIDSNRELLGKYPDLERGFRESIRDITLRDGMEAGAKARIARLESAKQNPITGFTGAQVGSEFNVGIINARNPAAAAREILKSARRDSTDKAVEGLKGGFFDYVIKQAETGLVDEAGNKMVSGRVLRRLLNEPNIRKVMNVLFDGKERTNFARTVADMVKIETAARKSVDIGGILDDTPSRLVTLAVGVQGAAQGRKVSQVLGGGTVQIPGMFASLYRKMANSLTSNSATQLLRDSLTKDPDLFKALMTGPGAPPKKVEQANAKIQAWMLGLAAEQGAAE